ncbi:MAG: hypothetical protein QXS42_05410 [Zestosphaera sp.]
MSDLKAFSTTLLLESSPDTYELLVKTLAKLKEDLLRLGYTCSVEEHSYLCSSPDTLVKIFPLPHTVETRMIEAHRFTIKVVLTSLDPRKLVQLNDLVATNVRGSGLRYRRTD